MGCDGGFQTNYKILVDQIKQHVDNGTTSDIIHLPVKTWKVLREKKMPFARRQRRQYIYDTSTTGLKNDLLNIQPDLNPTNKEKFLSHLYTSKLALPDTVKSIESTAGILTTTTEIMLKKIHNPKVIMVTAGKVFR